MRFLLVLILGMTLWLRIVFMLMSSGASEMAKYRNKKVTIDGVTFPSKKEGKRYQDLCLLEQSHHIRELQLQPKIKIEIGGIPLKFDSGRQVTYIGDFKYYDTHRQEWIIEDVKGFRTREYKLKKALVKAMGIKITET